MVTVVDGDLGLADHAGDVPNEIPSASLISTIRGNYPRKPRGGPAALDSAYDRRFSFCCDRDACRKRTTPSSVRFLGRHVYLAAVFVLASAMRHGITAMRAAKLTAWFSVSRRTLGRWRRWWLQTFVASEVWKRVCGRLMPAPEIETLPASWLDAMGAMDEVERVQWILALQHYQETRTTPVRTLQSQERRDRHAARQCERLRGDLGKDIGARRTVQRAFQRLIVTAALPGELDSRAVAIGAGHAAIRASEGRPVDPATLRRAPRPSRRGPVRRPLFRRSW